ncbi:MAG: molecular chaperone GrpE [Actinomycetota bacterium]|jgi:molecular chaperone GrpE|nr:molecular chaperone GrpE [Actinomycetota bacterium]
MNSERKAETEEVLDGEVVQDASPNEPDGDNGAEQEAPVDVRKLQDEILRAHADYQTLARNSVKRQAEAATRAKARVLEELLPLIDSFEAAVLHSVDQEGLQLLFKQLTQALQQQGLAEVPAEGKPFDPRMHEAVTTIEDPEATNEVVKEVFRKGYAMGDHLLRPAMVVVAKPASEGAPRGEDVRE